MSKQDTTAGGMERVGRMSPNQHLKVKVLKHFKEPALKV